MQVFMEISGLNLQAEAQLRQTSRLLTKGRIAVYPVQGGGIPAPFANDAANSNSKYVFHPTTLAGDMNDVHQNEAADRATMDRLAQDTGGRAFYNTNGLAQALSEALESGASFYTLTYAPKAGTSESRDDFRRIEVEVKGKGYEVSYRHGYYADQPFTSPPVDTAAAQSDATRNDTRFNEAMRRGSPDALQILFKARVLPTKDGPDAYAVANNRADPRIKGSWRRYQVDVAADPRPIQWLKGPGGSFVGTIAFAAAVYDDQGKLVNSLGNTVVVNLPREKMVEALETGVALTGEVSVPSKGTYWLRIGIRDKRTNNAGTIELPISAVKELTPANAKSQ